MKNLTVLIPNYNGEKLLKSFLPSIFEALNIAKIDYEFIVVDDCSTDESIEFLNKNYSKKITTLKDSTKLSFAHTCDKVIASANNIFNQAINDYHLYDNIDHPMVNPYDKSSIEHLLYLKCWIDTAQWHMEDVIRNPDIEPQDALYWKRRIDKQNQIRTDTVEYIDSYFLNLYSSTIPKPNAKINTESPAWAIDRLSILALKIYHMQEESGRKDAEQAHRDNCQAKLEILLQQRNDLSQSIEELLQDLQSGQKIMKVYKQMKMYNDPSLNPVLYAKQK
ncbi:DUF4254 domain-containing protein [Sphingobacterium sp. UT-1RO-CII-1]|uniref:DUF4254 domain-containing protein n=1 Tax=Sphingobacterium sp. UT-1RO-CII-1 TaxID=2995225 RepID=UPI002DD4316E|nr:DUF4254 domain-containing protein [Sphingobacterium sp. UT-1RO-CII-1]